MTRTHSLSPSRSLPGERSSTNQGNPVKAIAKVPDILLKTLYSWQDGGNGKAHLRKQSEFPFRDLGPSRGDGMTDYSQPVWCR